MLRTLCTADGGPASSLTKLHLGGQRAREAIETSALALHTRLRWLRWTLAADVSDECLISSLGMLTRLTELHLLGLSNISDTGLRVMSKLSLLVTLDLRGAGQLRDSTLVEAVQKLPMLHHLSLANMQLITPAFLDALFAKLPTSLAHIRITGSPHISAAACMAALVTCPDAAVEQLATVRVDNSCVVGSFEVEIELGVYNLDM